MSFFLTRYRVVFALFWVCFFTGCAPWVSVSMPATSTVPLVVDQKDVGVWSFVDKGIERAEFRFATSTDARMILYRLDPEEYRWRVIHALPPARLSVWQTRVTSSVLMINGGYFHEDYLPSGLLIAGGKRVGSRQFDEDKAGVLVLRPTPRFLTASLTSERIASWQEAVQSYPILIRDGVMGVATDTGRVARRTFMGADREGRVYMGIVPSFPLSLYQLSRALAHVPVSWSHVLNLDGGPSSGLMSRVPRAFEQIESYAEVPNVIVVESKPK